MKGCDAFQSFSFLLRQVRAHRTWTSKICLQQITCREFGQKLQYVNHQTSKSLEIIPFGQSTSRRIQNNLQFWIMVLQNVYCVKKLKTVSMRLNQRQKIFYEAIFREPMNSANFFSVCHFLFA